MRKFLIPILVLILCFGLCACTGGPAYPELEQLLGAGDYEGAIDWIEDMGGITEPTEPPTDPTEPEPDPGVLLKYAVLLREVEQLEEYIAQGLNIYNAASVRYSDETADYRYDGLDAISWIYHTAEELAAEYPAAADILACFTVVEDVLLGKTHSHVDALGNTVADSDAVYHYDANGTVTYWFDYYAPEYKYNVYGTPVHTYDENGSVTVTTYRHNGTVIAIIDYTYDQEGRLTSEVYRHTDGDSYRISYTYNAAGQLTRASGVPYSGSGERTMTVNYTYNAAGQLTREVGFEDGEDRSGNYYEAVVDYSYDENGNLATRRQYTRYCRSSGTIRRYQFVHDWEYTYDENGRIIETIYTDVGTLDSRGNYDYGGMGYSVTATPIYGDFYVYTSPATAP